MKLKHVLPLLSALVTGLALAAPATAQDARPYEIKIKADVAPVVDSELAYPHLAARHGLSGDCKLTIDISNGAAHDVRLVSCSNELFTGAAKRAARQLSFAPGVAAEDAPITIHWSIGDDAARPLVTASR